MLRIKTDMANTPKKKLVFKDEMYLSKSSHKFSDTFKKFRFM